jgi:hypothetical protein
MSPTADEPSVFVLGAGQSAKIGRLRAGNDFAVADPYLAPTHFVLRPSPEGYALTDLSLTVQKHPQCAHECFVDGLRNAPCAPAFCRMFDNSGELGVRVNGTKVREVILHNGDQIVAGTSCFAVRLVASSPEQAPAPPVEGRLSAERVERALAVVDRQRLPLFALVDAARDPRCLRTLQSHAEIYYSLYDGKQGEELEDVAPYLVQLSRGSRLTAALLEQWGNSWCTLVYCESDFRALRKHLRKFLIVENDAGKRTYFRFYDPRVLRAFIPPCTPAERADFFGPIVHFLVEGHEPDMGLIFSRPAGGSADSIRF